MKKILLTDDDAFIRDIVAVKLKEAGYEVTSAANGEAALTILKESTPDIMMLDLDMPGLSGTEVLEHMKGDAKLKDIPVIIFSNNSDEETAAKVKELGATDFYFKASTDISDLIAKVEASTS